MKINRMTWPAIAAVSAALCLAGCQKKEPVSVTSQPGTGELNTQGTPGSPEIAHNGPQGTALAPQTDVTAPENPAGAMGKETVTQLGTAGSDPAMPSDPDAEAAREQAASAAADRLAKLDSRVSDIRAHVDQLSNKAVFTDTLTDLKRLHETAQTSIDSLRDPKVRLDDARESSDRQMTEFEAAINSLQKRVERVASQTGA